MSLGVKSQEHDNIRPYICNYKFDFTLVQFHLSKLELDLLQKYPRIDQKLQPHVTSTIFRFGKSNEAQKIKI